MTLERTPEDRKTFELKAQELGLVHGRPAPADPPDAGILHRIHAELAVEFDRDDPERPEEAALPDQRPAEPRDRPAAGPAGPLHRSAASGDDV